MDAKNPAPITYFNQDIGKQLDSSPPVADMWLVAYTMQNMPEVSEYLVQ